MPLDNNFPQETSSKIEIVQDVKTVPDVNNKIEAYKDRPKQSNSMRDNVNFMKEKITLNNEGYLSKRSSYSDELKDQCNTSRVNDSILPCTVCFDKPADAVFMDCGHGGLCYDCSLDVWKTNEECYLCRMPIIKVLQFDVNTRKDVA